MRFVVVEKFILTEELKGVSDGYLAIPKRTRWRWTHCREVFHRGEIISPGRRVHYMAPQPNNNKKKRTGRLLFHSKNVASSISFVRMAEQILKLPPSKKVKILKTNRQKTIYIEYGPWWSEISRRELLTIFLKVGRTYNVRGLTPKQKQSRWWSLARNNRYIRQTKAAFKKFMSGHTKFNTDLTFKSNIYDYIKMKAVETILPVRWSGWCNTLHDKLDQKQIEDRMLSDK